MKTNKIDSLQIIRCFAAVLVAICHIWNDGWLPGEVVALGRFGVDLFFVLSGFIMCLTVRLNVGKKSENAAYFIRKRIVRIFPIYVVCAIPLILFNIKAEGFKTAYFYIGNVLLLPSVTNDPGYALVLGPGWSLVYEMFFYMTFALLMLFTFKKDRLLILNALSLFFLVLIVRFFGIQGPQLGWVNLTYMVGDTLMWNFVLGVAAYFLYEKLKKRISIPIWPGLFLFFGFIFLAAFLNANLSIGRFAAFGMPAFAIVSLLSITKNPTGNNRLLNTLIRIGDASYSIYLVHFYFVFFKPKFLPLQRYFGLDSTAFLNILDIILVICTVISGCIFYRLIEKPIIKLISSNLSPLKAGQLIGKSNA